MEEQNLNKLPNEGNTPSTPPPPLPADAPSSADMPQSAPAYVPPPPAYVPTPSYAPVGPQTNAWAIVSLVASILSWVGLFGLGGIVGVIAGVVARNQIKENPATQTGDGLALAGIILGAVNIAISCIGLLCVIAFFGSIPFWGWNGR